MSQKCFNCGSFPADKTKTFYEPEVAEGGPVVTDVDGLETPPGASQTTVYVCGDCKQYWH